MPIEFEDRTLPSADKDKVVGEIRACVALMIGRLGMPLAEVSWEEMDSHWVAVVHDVQADAFVSVATGSTLEEAVICACGRAILERMLVEYQDALDVMAVEPQNISDVADDTDLSN